MDDTWGAEKGAGRSGPAFDFRPLRLRFPDLTGLVHPTTPPPAGSPARPAPPPAQPPRATPFAAPSADAPAPPLRPVPLDTPEPAPMQVPETVPVASLLTTPPPAPRPAPPPPASPPASPPAPPQATAPAATPDPRAQYAALQEIAQAFAAFERHAEETADTLDQVVARAASAGGQGRMPDWVGELARQAPRLLQGEDRLKFYAQRLDEVDVEKREALRDFVEGFVAKMHEMKASDMDFGGPACVGRVWYRVDGDKSPHFELGVSSNDEIDVLILNLLSPRQKEDLFFAQSADFSYFLPTGAGTQRRFRCTAYFDTGHLGLCMRAINETVRPLSSLGFHPLIQRGMMFRHVRDGLTLFTGVTGSGKSTSLDAIIDANNHDFDGHIVIVAKPIEYMHAPDRCIIRHREVGADVPSFKDGVIQALRQDPDIIMIGEMRDPETISSAIEAADTGHKVFSTLHTSSAVESLDRMVAEYPHAEQDRIRIRLGDVLRCVVSQKLAPKLGGGRVLVKEVLWVTANVKAAILNGNTGEIYQMMWEGGKQGMITLEQDLVRLVRERKITPEIGLQYANNKRRFQQLIG